MTQQKQKISRGRLILALHHKAGRRLSTEESERRLRVESPLRSAPNPRPPTRFAIKVRNGEGVMKMDYQRINAYLIGNASKEGVVKQAKESGKPYADFDLAVRNRREETTYFPVRCFGKLAESVANIDKGTKVFVDGELEIATFEGDDGQKRKSFRVLANTYRILGKGRRSADEAEPV
jgi:single-strand DNA-binding protein